MKTTIKAASCYFVISNQSIKVFQDYNLALDFRPTVTSILCIYPGKQIDLWRIMMLSIGTFSKISKVTTNALRYYDEIGLIKPAEVNRDNGYRYYEVAQLQTILLINKLKSYNLSLEEISEVLQNPEDNSLLLSLMKQKRQEIQQSLHQLTYTLNQIDQDVSNLERGIHIMSYLDKIEIQLKEIEPQNILFIRKRMSTNDSGLYFAQLAETIKQEKLTATGAPLTVFHHLEEEFNPDCYENEVAIPIKEAVKGTRQLPGGLCATVTLNGPYTELPAVYTKIQQWIEQENYEQSSEPYEVYLTDPFTTDPEKNITQVYVPIKK